MSRRHDPEPRRCGTCMIRLSRQDPDHEERCSREKAGRPPLEDDDGARAASGEGCRYGGADCHSACIGQARCYWREEWRHGA